ncbi:MAG TPA: hypothetical protein VIG74_01690 [Alphaproteobacteria bacterium]
MRLNKLLLSTVISAGFFLGAGQASAATPKVLQPEGNWAVSKIAGQGGPENSYCALARKFSDDIILTMASNRGGETSVAIDFQKEGLTKGQNYNVTLRPGPGVERSYDVRAVSGKALVVRMGQDKAFHDALTQSGNLGVAVAGQDYTFAMPDIDNGRSDVEGCLAALAQPAAGNEEAASTSVPAPVGDKRAEKIFRSAAVDEMPSPSAAPVQAVEQRVVPVVPLSPSDVNGVPASREADALREENTRLRNALERERRDYENRFMQQDDSTSVAFELNEKIRLLESENNSLKGKLSSAPVSAPVAAVAAAAPVCPTPEKSVDNTAATQAMAGELVKLRDENAKLKQSKSVVADTVAPAELEKLRADNASLRQQVEGLNVKLAQRESAQAADLKAQLQQAKAAPDAKSVEAIGKLQGRIEVLEAENAGLKESLRVAEQKAMAAPKVAAAPVSSGVTLAQLRGVEEQLKQAQSERDSLRSQMEGLRAGKEEAAIGTIAGNNWDLEQATRRFNEAERELRRLGAELEQQRGQCAAEKKEIEYMLFDPAIAEQEQIAKLTTLEQELAEAKAGGDSKGYEEKIASLENQLAAKEAELSDARAAQDRMAQQVAAAPVSSPRPQQQAMADTGMDMSIEPPSAPERISDRDASKSESARIENAERSYTTAATVSRPLRDIPAQERSAAMPVLKDQGSPHGEATAAISPAAGVPAFEPIERTAIPAAVPVSAPVRASASTMSEREIGAFLSRAQIDVKGGIKKVRGAATAGYDAYSWETGDLFGSAEVHAMTTGDEFNSLMNRYIERTKSRCQGDFASVPVPVQGGAGSQIGAYEIACVGSAASASASVVFFIQDGQFVTIAHEAPVEGMDVAMDAREHIIATLSGSKVASN